MNLKEAPFKSGQGSFIAFVSCSWLKVCVFNCVYDHDATSVNIDIVYTVRCTNFKFWWWDGNGEDPCALEEGGKILSQASYYSSSIKEKWNV
jgi:hypothetical protein